MKIRVAGQIFPRAREAAVNVRKLGEKRRRFNIGSQSLCFSVWEVELPEGCEVDGGRIRTPSGVCLYHNKGGQYEAGYLISGDDKDPLVAKHF